MPLLSDPACRHCAHQDGRRSGWRRVRRTSPGARLRPGGSSDVVFAIHSRRGASMRVCHPRPPARKCSITSRDRRMVVDTFGLALGGRPRRTVARANFSGQPSVERSGAFLRGSSIACAWPAPQRSGRPFPGVSPFVRTRHGRHDAPARTDESLGLAIAAPAPNAAVGV